jgi:nucleotidyltransferase-like protein
MRWQRAMGREETPKKMVIAEEVNLAGTEPFCGIVLAGGEGKRLRPFVHLLRKDLLPKQYVNFIGRRSMLEHTLHRAEKLIPSERLFIVLNEAHLGFPEVQQQICKRPPGTIIVQPENKETGPGLLLPLMHLFPRLSEFGGGHLPVGSLRFRRARTDALCATWSSGR